MLITRDASDNEAGIKKFKYLGVAFTIDGKLGEELDTGISKASVIVQDLHYSVVMKEELSKKTKL